MAELDARARALVERFQRDEETDHIVYGRMAAAEKNPDNRAVLHRIAGDEREHAAIWRRYSGRDIAPDRWRVAWFTLLGYLFGYTFVIKLMERGEEVTAREYGILLAAVPEAAAIIEQEKSHERQLHALLDEERLRYVGAMVLGLNDALVELTGAIAGFTFALADNRVVAMLGIITGVSATFSMAASNYLAERADDNPNALTSSLYTGVAYLITVVLLVTPYLLFPRPLYLAAFAAMLGVVVLIIATFNYYVSVAKDLPFWRRFAEMSAISLGVAVLSFGIGLAARTFLGVEV